jgi:hypothetical protein
MAIPSRKTPVLLHSLERERERDMMRVLIFGVLGGFQSISYG